MLGGSCLTRGVKGQECIHTSFQDPQGPQVGKSFCSLPPKGTEPCAWSITLPWDMASACSPAGMSSEKEWARALGWCFCCAPS